MRTVTIMTSEENNFNMIFIYDNDVLCGMNYKMIHKGITERDFVNNSELFQIYLDKAPVNNFKQYQVGCDAVMKYQDRENIREAINDLTDEMIELMVKDERVGIEPGNFILSEDEIAMIKELEAKIHNTITTLYKTRQIL